MKYVGGDPRADRIVMRAVHAVEQGDTQINFGCVAGRHRSVAMAEITAATLELKGYTVMVTHRELPQ